MKVAVRATRAGTIADLQDRDELTLVELSQDVAVIKEDFGNRPAIREFDGFLVDIGEGEYGDVYGFHGSVPDLSKPVFKITRTFSESKPKKGKQVTKKRTTKKSPSGLGGIR